MKYSYQHGLLIYRCYTYCSYSNLQKSTSQNCTVFSQVILQEITKTTGLFGGFGLLMRCCFSQTAQCILLHWQTLICSSIMTQCDGVSVPVRQLLYRPGAPVLQQGRAEFCANANKAPVPHTLLLQRCTCRHACAKHGTEETCCSCTFLLSRSWITLPPPQHPPAWGPQGTKKSDGRVN